MAQIFNRGKPQGMLVLGPWAFSFCPLLTSLGFLSFFFGSGGDTCPSVPLEDRPKNMTPYGCGFKIELDRGKFRRF